MPEHVHLMVYPLPDADTIDALLKAIKRPFSYRIKQLLIQSRSRLLERLTIHQRPGVTTFRYWQEGPGYDRNFIKPSTVLAAIDYLHHNPVRRGLVKRAVDWKWSSARYYLLDPPQQYAGSADRSQPAGRMAERARLARPRRHCWTSQQWHPAPGSARRRTARRKAYFYHLTQGGQVPRKSENANFSTVAEIPQCGMVPRSCHDWGCPEGGCLVTDRHLLAAGCL